MLVKSVLGLHQVDAHPRAVLGRQARLHCLKGQQQLGKHLLGRGPAQGQVKIPHLHLARRRGLRRAAVFHLPPSGLSLARLIAAGLHFVAQALVHQLLAEPGERLRIALRQLYVPADLFRRFLGVRGGC